MAVLGRCHQEAPRRLVNPSLTVSSPCCTHRALHRRCNVGAFRTPVTLANARRCRPTQKAHFCDRHHIASAMAELASCLSIIPHMRSFDVPPKLSPAHAGLFLRRSTQRGARDWHCVRPAAVRCARSLGRAAQWCFARSGRFRRRAFSAHCRCCAGVIRKGQSGSIELERPSAKPIDELHYGNTPRRCPAFNFRPAIALWGPHPN